MKKIRDVLRLAGGFAGKFASCSPPQPVARSHAGAD